MALAINHPMPLMGHYGTHGALSVCILHSDRSVCRSAWIVRICLQLVADQKLCLGVCIIIWVLLFYDALLTVY